MNRALSDRICSLEYLNRHLASRLAHVSVDLSDLLRIDPEAVRDAECAEEGSALAEAAPLPQGFCLPPRSHFLAVRALEHKHQILDAAAPLDWRLVQHWHQFDREPRVRKPKDRFTGNRMACCALEERLRNAGVLDLHLDGVYDHVIAEGVQIRCIDLVVGECKTSCCTSS